MSFSENGLTLHWLIMHCFIIIQIIPIWMAINGLSSHPYGMPAHLPGSSTFPTCRGTGSKLCWKFDPNVRCFRPSGSFTWSRGLLKQYPKVKSSRPQLVRFQQNAVASTGLGCRKNGVYHQHRFLSRENEQWIWGCTKERGTARQRNALQTPVELTAEPAVWLPKHLRKQLKFSFCGIQKHISQKLKKRLLNKFWVTANSSDLTGSFSQTGPALFVPIKMCL